MSDALTVRLIRVGQSPRGTFGVLSFEMVPFALTMERPWVNNEAFISCIPPGLYVCRAIRSPRFGQTYEITDVPGRTHVLLHPGNELDDTEGCIMVAEEFGGTFDSPKLVSSQRGFGELKALVSGYPEWLIDIVDGSHLTNVTGSTSI